MNTVGIIKIGTDLEHFVDWSNEQNRARLQKLWGEGHSTREIGVRMSISKNAVVGAAHRMGLPSRPSPIKKDASREVEGPAKPRVPRRALLSLDDLEAEQLPSEPAVRHDPERLNALREAARRIAEQSKDHGADRAFRAPAEVDMHRRAAKLFAAPAAPGGTGSHPCCWPTWPDSKGSAYWEAITDGRYLQCDAPAPLGKPYCPEHAAKAFSKTSAVRGLSQLAGLR